MLESFRAANEAYGDLTPALSSAPFDSCSERSELVERAEERERALPLRRGGGRRGSRVVSEFTETSPLAELKHELSRQQKINERARHRIIGLTLETRPDCIAPKTIWQMRELGCTRVELGVQHTDDEILKLTKRGHDTAAAKRATRLLKDYGFKTDFHLMPQLPGATPDKDLMMLKRVFADPDLRPDMIKIYPCSVVKGSELYDWFKAGRFHTYPTEELIRILKIFKSAVVPRYCRISRLIRDIPGQYIKEGNKITNLRQVIQRELKAEGLRCPCLRCREIGHQTLPDLPSIPSSVEEGTSNVEEGTSNLPLYKGGGRRGFRVGLLPRLFVDKYKASGGTEYFLSFEDAARRIVFAFCRLRLTARAGSRLEPKSKGGVGGLYPAFIRELHTYGQLVGLGKREAAASQHTGLGKKLVKKAERLARQAGAPKLAVIAGIGVRDYYRLLGYRLEKTYMVKKL